ncbi:hypothetical protein [Pedobacter sp.]
MFKPIKERIEFYDGPSYMENHWLCFSSSTLLTLKCYGWVETCPTKPQAF